MIKSKYLTYIFQKFLINRDIRIFKNSLIYYILFRVFRNFLTQDIILKIYNFKIYGSINKFKTSYFLLKKCEFGDYHELKIIKKISNKNKILFIDCGCNYGFYSFYSSSLSKKNEIIAVEASKTTSDDFIANFKLNNFFNIKFFNRAISDVDNKIVIFKESEKDWESSMVHQNYKISETQNIYSIKIETLTQNYDLKSFQIIIKLDIEGNEINAIKGSLNIIKKFSPLIIIEFSKYIFDRFENIKYLKNFLTEYDYSIYDTNNKQQNLENILKKLNNLKKKYQTIGNYYLIKNQSKTLKVFLDND